MSYTTHDGNPAIGAVVLTAGAGGVAGVLKPDDNENARAAIVRTPVEQLTDALEALKRGSALEARFIRYAEPLTDPGVHISNLGSNIVQLLNGQFEVQSLYTLDDPSAVLRLPKSPIIRGSYRGAQFGQRIPFKIDSADMAQTLTPAYDHFILDTPANLNTQLFFQANNATPDAPAAGSAPATAPAAAGVGSLEIKLYVRNLAGGQTLDIYRDGGIQIISFAGPFASIELTMMWAAGITGYGADKWTRGNLSLNGAGLTTIWNDGPI